MRELGPRVQPQEFVKGVPVAARGLDEARISELVEKFLRLPGVATDQGAGQAGADGGTVDQGQSTKQLLRCCTQLSERQ